MSSRTTPVRRQRHNDKSVRMVANSKAHLRRLSKIHYELLSTAVTATQAVVVIGKKYREELRTLDIVPTLNMIAAQIKTSSDKQRQIEDRINAMSSKSRDPFADLTDILLELNDESMAITSGISDPLLDVMSDMNRRLPLHDQFDMNDIESLITQLDEDVAANNPVAQIPETNRVMQ